MFPWSHPRPLSRQPRIRRSVRLVLEELECRRVLSSLAICGPQLEPPGTDHHEDHGSGVDETHGSGPAIRLDLVALHEFGHSLGLGHSKDPNSIMYSYYNANYNTANFANDSSIASLLSLYQNVNTSAWSDAFDPSPGNGTVDITFSFMPDGVRMDGGNPRKPNVNTLFQTMNSHFGDPATWQPIFRNMLNLWESVSNGKLNFIEVQETGANAFNVSGNSQNDTRFGDIRIGAHKFDGPGRVIAHAYYPPPNGYTAAGDAHFDNAENWVVAASASPVTATPSAGSSGSPKGKGGKGNIGEDPQDRLALAILQAARGSSTDVVAIPVNSALVLLPARSEPLLADAASREDNSSASLAAFGSIGIGEVPVEEPEELEEIPVPEPSNKDGLSARSLEAEQAVRRLAGSPVGDPEQDLFLHDENTMGDLFFRELGLPGEMPTADMPKTQLADFGLLSGREIGMAALALVSACYWEERSRTKPVGLQRI